MRHVQITESETETGATESPRDHLVAASMSFCMPGLFAEWQLRNFEVLESIRPLASSPFPRVCCAGCAV